MLRATMLEWMLMTAPYSVSVDSQTEVRRWIAAYLRMLIPVAPKARVVFGVNRGTAAWRTAPIQAVRTIRSALLFHCLVARAMNLALTVNVRIVVLSREALVAYVRISTTRQRAMPPVIAVGVQPVAVALIFRHVCARIYLVSNHAAYLSRPELLEAERVLLCITHCR